MECAFDVKDGLTDVPAAVHAAAAGEQWAGMLKLVADEYPYCTMHGVHVVEGCIVACEGIQSSFVFGPSSAAAVPCEPAFDAHWQALRALCARLRSGRIAEIRFSRGRPVTARVAEGGRRFRRLMMKGTARQSPMS